MRKLFISWLFIAAALFVSCSDDNTTPDADWFGPAQTENVTGTSAYVICPTNFAQGVLTAENAGVSYAPVKEDGSLGESRDSEDCQIIGGKTIKARLMHLTPNTTYQANPFLRMSNSRIQGAAFTFKTKEVAPGEIVFEITSKNPMELSGDAAAYEILYDVVNPVGDILPKVQVAAGGEWVEQIDNSKFGKIAFHVTENTVEERSTVLEITYADLEPQKVTVKQAVKGETPGPVGDAIYANNFDKADAQKTDNKWPYLDQTDVWQNQTGSGASTVSYESKSISVRQSGKLSGGYTGASAHNKIFFGSTPNEFVIKDITLPAGKKNFRLTFGGNYYDFNAKSNTFDISKMPIRLGNGTGWSGNITYTKIEGSDEVDPYWTLFAADFTLPEGTKTLSIKFSAEQASVFAIDDVVLAEGQGGQAISFDGSVDPEPEPEPTPGNSIADIIKGGEGQAVSVEAQIVAKHKFGFVLQDATGRLYVYTAAEQKIGDTVKVEGTTGSFNGMFQIGKGATVTLVKAGEFTQPTPKVWNGAQIESYTKGSTYAIEYVQFEGTLNVTENPKYPGSFYYNVVLNGTSVKGSLVNPVDEEGIKALNNKKVTVKGYSVGAAGKNKDFFNVVAVEVSGEGGVTPEPGPEPEPGPDPAPGVHTAYSGWAELPNEDLSKKNSEFFYASHLCPDIYTASRNKARNFTTCYSKSKICPVWVAAPLHDSYAGGGRHDAYKPDPDIPCTQNGKWEGYTRGHMLGSAERNRTVATNHQVFYFSNIGPQVQQYFNTGGGQWNTAEDWVDKQWRGLNDTCYQVVGCYWDPSISPKHVKGTEIPTHYYTVLLKAKKGVKKWVVDCSADELQAIVIWVRHKSYSKGEVVKPNNFEAKGMFKTVEEVERLTGHKFFMNVPNAPKSKFNTSDWNF